MWNPQKFLERRKNLCKLMFLINAPSSLACELMRRVEDEQKQIRTKGKTTFLTPRTVQERYLWSSLFSLQKPRRISQTFTLLDDFLHFSEASAMILHPEHSWNKEAEKINLFSLEGNRKNGKLLVFGINITLLNFPTRKFRFFFEMNASVV